MDILWSILWWVVWALVLMGQAGTSTWASRARNSMSVGYHGFAAIFSHGVWFVSNCFLGYSLLDIARSGGVKDVIFVGVFYTVWCTLGSMLAHYVTATYFEIGKRRVGGES